MKAFIGLRTLSGSLQSSCFEAGRLNARRLLAPFNFVISSDTPTTKTSSSSSPMSGNPKSGSWDGRIKVDVDPSLDDGDSGVPLEQCCWGGEGVG